MSETKAVQAVPLTFLAWHVWRRYGDDMARDVIEVDVICNSVSDDTGRTHFIINHWNRALLAWNANTCMK